MFYNIIIIFSFIHLFNYLLTIENLMNVNYDFKQILRTNTRIVD